MCVVLITFGVNSPLQRVFGGDVDAVGAVIIGPIVHRNCVSDVEVGGGSLPVGQSSLSVVEVKNVGAVAELGLHGGGANGGWTTDVNVLGTPHRVFDDGVFVVFHFVDAERRRVVAIDAARVQLNVDG